MKVFIGNCIGFSKEFVKGLNHFLVNHAYVYRKIVSFSGNFGLNMRRSIVVNYHHVIKTFFEWKPDNFFGNNGILASIM